MIRMTIVIHSEVSDALRGGRPVVALETAVLTTGLPRSPFAPAGVDAPGWNDERPANLETVLLMQRLVRQAGAVPALVGVLRGALHVGMDEDQIGALAGDERADKASITSLAHAMASGASAGTTVSATLHACALPPLAGEGLPPIRVLATGGIGGVHRDWQRAPDISADLGQIARTPTCIVCAGAKSILDLPATLEALQTLGVPVVGYRTDCFPLFHTRGSKSLALRQVVLEAREAAELCRVQWHVLGRRGGVVLANPISEDAALDPVELSRAIFEAEERATAQGISGDARTPFLLEEVRRRTGGRSLLANIALLAANARLGALVAQELARM
jgi:pseudouridylate synthase